MLALDGDTVAGSVEVLVKEYDGRQVGYTNLFYLLPEWRGQGRGMEVMHFAEDFFAEHGLGEYHLRVSSLNQHAVRFYERCGFALISEDKNGPHPVWRMAKGAPLSV